MTYNYTATRLSAGSAGVETPAQIMEALRAAAEVSRLKPTFKL
jgi:hypothetical protein